MPVALLDSEIWNAKSSAGEFFRSVNRQMFLNQGVHVASPDGKALANSMPGRFEDGKVIHTDETKMETWIHEVEAALKRGLKRFGDVTPRRAPMGDWLPSDGAGVLPDGRAPLVAYTRSMQRGLDRDYFGRVVIDSVTLAADEWGALAPAPLEPGTEWPLRETVARKFNLVLSTSCSDSLPRPEETSAVRFTGKVQSLQDSVAYLKYEGRIAGAHRSGHGYTWTSEAWVVGGVGACDKTGKMLSITLVFEGERRNTKYYAPSDEPERFGAVLQWRREPRAP